MIIPFDLETIHDPSLPPYPSDAHGRGRMPPPPYHQVVCAGFLALDAKLQTVKIDASAGPDERPILERTLGALRSDTELVTYNGRGFDVPVLTARAFKHGLDFSWLVNRKGARYRFTREGHEDLMDELSDYGSARSVGGLDVWAQLAGFPGKLGADGTNVSGWFADCAYDVIAAYCLSDVVQTTAVALRLWLTRGIISRETYSSAARSLLAAVAADERVRPLLAKVDEARFLLAAPVAPAAVANDSEAA